MTCLQMCCITEARFGHSEFESLTDCSGPTPNFDSEVRLNFPEVCQDFDNQTSMPHRFLGERELIDRLPSDLDLVTKVKGIIEV